MQRKEFLSRKRVGAILRVFANKAGDVSRRVNMVREALAQIAALQVDGQQPICRVDLMVWADERYADADCSETAAALRTAFPKSGHNYGVLDIRIHEVRHGDLFCTLLNYAVAMQLRDRIDYSLILSPEAFSYLNSDTMAAMIDAACKGARAIGVAINELTESILAGRLANTFCMWDNVSLMSVGGFDLRAAKPTKDAQGVPHMHGWGPGRGEVYYPLAGVEEVIPLARLVAVFGQCIAPLRPQGDGVQQYKVPTDSVLLARHLAKLGTKRERQIAHLAAIGYDPSFLLGGILEQYRDPEVFEG